MLSILLWGLLISVVSFNVGMHKKTVIALPMSWVEHKAMAEYFWAHGSRQAAKNEMAIAQELSPPDTSDVLGTTSWEQEPARTDELIAYWKQIALSRPDYRDAYVQLAALSYSRGDLKSAKSYLDMARTLDPNGSIVSSLGEFITKQLE